MNLYILPTQTSHGGSGFLRDSLAFKRRSDLLLNPPGTGDLESTFLEIIRNKKNLIIGCIYRHPSSKITIEDFAVKII